MLLLQRGAGDARRWGGYQKIPFRRKGSFNLLTRNGIKGSRLPVCEGSEEYMYARPIDSLNHQAIMIYRMVIVVFFPLD